MKPIISWGLAENHRLGFHIYVPRRDFLAVAFGNPMIFDFGWSRRSGFYFYTRRRRGR